MKLRTIVLMVSISFTAARGYSQGQPVSDTTGLMGNNFAKMDEEAFFPGGEAAWRKYLEQNLNANTPVDNGAPVGKFTIEVQFIVGADGTISDIKTLTKLGYGMEPEVVRIMKKSGLWTPAILNGKPVKAYRKQPVTFVVMAEDFDIQSKTPYTLFTGIDNELMVEANKVKTENLQLTISQGNITPAGDGKFIARVSKPGRVIVSVFNAKKNKKIGDASFEVKTSSEPAPKN